MPHRNREVSLTYQGDEEHPINVQVETEKEEEVNDNTPFVNNIKGESDDHKVPLHVLEKRYKTDLHKGLTAQ